MSEPRGPGWVGTIAVFVIACILGAVVGGTVCGLLVRLGTETRHAHNKYLAECAALKPVLKKDPASNAIEINEETGGGIWLTGSVATEADQKRLKEAVIRAIGERRTEQVRGVRVEKKPSTDSIPPPGSR